MVDSVALKVGRLRGLVRQIEREVTELEFLVLRRGESED